MHSIVRKCSRATAIQNRNYLLQIEHEKYFVHYSYACYYVLATNLLYAINTNLLGIRISIVVGIHQIFQANVCSSHYGDHLLNHKIMRSHMSQSNFHTKCEVTSHIRVRIFGVYSRRIDSRSDQKFEQIPKFYYY